jgi:chorismate mutase/prephenate dehydratase
MNLDEIRQEIDTLDADIVRQINRRAALAIDIAGAKRDQGAPIRDVEREAEVMARVREVNEGPLRDHAVESIYRQIIMACLDLEKRETAR